MRTCASLVLSTLLIATRVLAWAGQGHEGISSVAAEQLTPETKSAIKPLPTHGATPVIISVRPDEVYVGS
jgi:hypothetical protein